MTSATADKAAPMAAAPMKYADDGSVAWDEMWDSFCALAREGGPPHRPTLLMAEESADPDSEAYRFAAAEICRGIRAVSTLDATPATTGWVAVACGSPAKARWLAESIEQEGVQARAEGSTLLVPAGASFTLKGEIKNVITAVAKTTHYWADHLPNEVKGALAWQDRLEGVGSRLRSWLRR